MAGYNNDSLSTYKVAGLGFVTINETNSTMWQWLYKLQWKKNSMFLIVVKYEYDYL